ncbi:hypothetical protein [Pseudomonas indica]|uniref:hypothetical protein n=1 Tax=Pseudomonas indica TaxID=137658 RepID=UPI00111C5AA5|nr:hypothetical protein [Pseudomonas indica]
MAVLVFEKVGDIHSEYPYLCVYLSGETAPFLEVTVNSDRKLEFKFYSIGKDFSLGVDEMKEIVSRAEVFLPQALENEDSAF